MLRFSSGEFAQICGVKKATLFHYDEIGLLKPSAVGANGYRYYGDREVYLFDVISALKEVGYSLGAIRDYLDRRDPERFVEILQEGRRRLEAEKARIERIDRLFASSVATTRGAANHEEGVVRIVGQGEEYLVAHRAASAGEDFGKEVFLRAREHIEYCKRRNLALSMPIGLIYGWGLGRDEEPRESFYFTKVAERIADPHFRLKPAGLYATLYHRGSYESIGAALRALRDRAESERYEIVGDAYEEDQLSFFTTEEEESYLCKLSTPVRRRGGSYRRPARA